MLLVPSIWELYTASRRTNIAMKSSALGRMLETPFSWTHYTVLIEIGELDARRPYESMTVRQAWSVRELRSRIVGDLYARSLAEPNRVAPAEDALSPVDPADGFRDLYNLELPGLPSGFSEAVLEAALRRNFERFLDELGPDFYVRRTQQRMVVDGRYHRVDLELYHRGIPCMVLVDLKVGEFEDRYVGQMNKYVNYYRERAPSYTWERPTIGLIVCERAGKEEVRYALGGLEEKIFVAEYRVKLPTEEVIGARLGQLGDTE